MPEMRPAAVSPIKRPEFHVVGVAQFDEEHRVLATYIGQLQDCVIHERPAPYVIGILRSVQNYAAEHFRHEEAAMESWGYPGLDEHHLEHQLIIDKIRRLLEDASMGGVVLSNSVIDLLVEWMMEHIERFDLGYANYYNKTHL